MPLANTDSGACRPSITTPWTTNGLPSASTWLPRTVRVWPSASGVGGCAHVREYGGIGVVDALATDLDGPLHAISTVSATTLMAASVATVTVRDRIVIFAP